MIKMGDVGLSPLGVGVIVGLAITLILVCCVIAISELLNNKGD